MLGIMKRFVLLATFLFAFGSAGASELPSDVKSFIDDREGCDHFRGEPWDSGSDPDIKERREFIFENIKQLCTGTDKRLATLRRKHRSNLNVIERLSDYEDTIELKKGRR
ncbi:MAG: hypothetical protein HHJ12_15820 [Glaciimonas sp.]|nr:hypothetical protein [Glaciimonas sp.]